MDLGLGGKVSLVHAGGGGLGSAIAIALSREGCHVIVCDFSLDAAKATVDQIRSQGGRATAIEWDLAEVDTFAERLNRVNQDVGGVDILINNTGGPPPSTVAGVPVSHWREQFDKMVIAVMHMTDLVLPHMKASRWGRVLTSVSSGVVSPIPDLGVSNTLRTALLGWSKSLAKEIAPYGVTTNVIVPGRIGTARILKLDQDRAERTGSTLDEARDSSILSIPLGRYGEPAEYADVATFLVSAKNSYMTGSMTRVDGGLIPSI